MDVEDNIVISGNLGVNLCFGVMWCTDNAIVILHSIVWNLRIDLDNWEVIHLKNLCSMFHLEQRPGWDETPTQVGLSLKWLMAHKIWLLF